MSTRVVDRVEGWNSQPFEGGFRELHRLADREFSGVVRVGTAELYMTSGACVGVRQGSIDEFEGASGTRLSTWRDPEILRTNTFYSMIEETNTSDVQFLPRVPQFTELNEVLSDMVRSAVVDRERSPEEAVEHAAAETRDLME